MSRTSSTLDLAAVTALVHLARERNFTAVARRMGVTPSAVSKAIARLEDDLGTTLVTRNSRSLALTPDGYAFHTHCRQLLGLLEEARRSISHSTASPTGQLRISLPEGYGRVVISPRLAEFNQRYEDLHLEIFLTDQRLEFIESNMDAAIWTGPLPPSRLIARRLPPLRYLICASPRYLEEHGTPRKLEDLSAHAQLGAIAKRTGQLQHWRFKIDDAIIEHAIKPRIQSDSIAALIDLAVNDRGIAQLTDYAAKDALASGRLVPILTEFGGASTPLHIVYLAEAKKLSRVKVFVDFAIEAIREERRATDLVLARVGALPH